MELFNAQDIAFTWVIKFSRSCNDHSDVFQVVAIVSCLFVVVSTLCLIFSTLPAFQVKDETGKIQSRKIKHFSSASMY